jgi:hypothetical protein
MRFEVKFENEIIGFSELEAEDAAMGVAFGRLEPTAAYSSFQPHCLEHPDRCASMPALTVSLPDGEPIECAGGVQIVDFSRELGDAAIQVFLLGVTNPRYEQLFPHHVKAHEDYWKKRS